MQREFVRRAAHFLVLLSGLFPVDGATVLGATPNADHGALATLLASATEISALKSRLSERWQILGMDAAAPYVQGNLVGRGLGVAAKNCGISLVWDRSLPPAKLVWPVLLGEVTAPEIERYLDQPWVSAGRVPPAYLKDASVEVSNHVKQWGLGLVAISLENSQRDQELNFVFVDGQRVDANNDLAVLDYAVISTVAGFPMPDGSSVDADYSFLASGQQLEILAGTNDTRLERVCRGLSLISAICGGGLPRASQDGARQLLGGIDARCAPSSPVIEGFRKLELDIAEGIKK